MAAASINSDTDNELFDSRFQEIARAIAGGIMGTLDHESVEEVPVYYRVQVGAYRQRQNADNLLYELMDKGYPAFILSDGGLYKVQVGAYRQLANAVTMEQKLRREGYSTMIAT